MAQPLFKFHIGVPVKLLRWILSPIENPFLCEARSSLCVSVAGGFATVTDSPLIRRYSFPLLGNYTNGMRDYPLVFRDTVWNNYVGPHYNTEGENGTTEEETSSD